MSGLKALIMSITVHAYAALIRHINRHINVCSINGYFPFKKRKVLHYFLKGHSIMSEITVTKNTKTRWHSSFSKESL